MSKNGIRIIYRRRLDWSCGVVCFFGCLGSVLGRVGKIERIDGLESCIFIKFRCVFAFCWMLVGIVSLQTG